MIHHTLSDWNKTMHAPSIDSLCLHIRESEGLSQLEKVHQYFREHATGIRSAIGVDVYAILNHCLEMMKMVSRFSADFQKYMQTRDLIMYENTLFFELALSPDKIMVYTHFEHANHMAIGNSGYSYGHYMKNYRHNEYGCIGLFAEKGAISVLDKTKIYEDKKMADALPNSFERFLAKEDSDYYFYLLPKQEKSVFSVRSIGSRYHPKPFKALLLSNYIDAAIFIREGTPVNTQF